MSVAVTIAERDAHNGSALLQEFRRSGEIVLKTERPDLLVSCYILVTRRESSTGRYAGERADLRIQTEEIGLVVDGEFETLGEARASGVEADAILIAPPRGAADRSRDWWKR